ncbi:Luc7-like protein 3 [Lamellibrachia satsuma]|nr:Luc7-like protein 3 [Lamellibrachia satsuma]
MASTAAALLDELMGRDRNLAPTEKRKEIKWDDPSVCKYFLVDFCPHELFVNTRADLGPCNKLHEEDLRKNYQKSRHCGQMGYEEDFMRFLQTLVADVEKRIRRGHARLALNNAAQQNSVAGGTQAAKQEKIEMLTKKINDLVEKAEELGCEGKVEEAQGMMMLCEKLKEERNDLESVG